MRARDTNARPSPRQSRVKARGSKQMILGNISIRKCNSERINFSTRSGDGHWWTEFRTSVAPRSSVLHVAPSASLSTARRSSGKQFERSLILTFQRESHLMTHVSRFSVTFRSALVRRVIDCLKCHAWNCSKSRLNSLDFPLQSFPKFCIRAVSRSSSLSSQTLIFFARHSLFTRILLACLFGGLSTLSQFRH